jgi:hypothetical protein
MDRPSDEPLVDAIRAIMTEVMAPLLVRDRDMLVTRYELRRKFPAIAKASFEEQERSEGMFAALIARHLRRPVDDVDVRIACAALTGALRETFVVWLVQGAKGGEQRLREMLHHTIDRIESALRF